LSIDTPGVSVEELLDFEINGLLDHISGGLADVGIKLAGILKRLLEDDGGGWVWIDWLFRCNLSSRRILMPSVGRLNCEFDLSAGYAVN
jgi:hypothetical protein